MDASDIRDPIPQNFSSLEEAAEFWDTHSLADYSDLVHDVEIEVRAPRRQQIVLSAELARQVAKRAQQEGISVETLVNLWVAERLRAAV